MFVVEVMNRDTKIKKSHYFKTLDEALNEFKYNDKLGNECALFNLK